MKMNEMREFADLFDNILNDKKFEPSYYFQCVKMIVH